MITISTIRTLASILLSSCLYTLSGLHSKIQKQMAQYYFTIGQTDNLQRIDMLVGWSQGIYRICYGLLLMLIPVLDNKWMMDSIYNAISYASIVCCLIISFNPFNSFFLLYLAYIIICIITPIALVQPFYRMSTNRDDKLKQMQKQKQGWESNMFGIVVGCLSILGARAGEHMLMAYKQMYIVGALPLQGYGGRDYYISIAITVISILTITSSILCIKQPSCQQHPHSISSISQWLDTTSNILIRSKQCIGMLLLVAVMAVCAQFVCLYSVGVDGWQGYEYDAGYYIQGNALVDQMLAFVLSLLIAYGLQCRYLYIISLSYLFLLLTSCVLLLLLKYSVSGTLVWIIMNATLKCGSVYSIIAVLNWLSGYLSLTFGASLTIFVSGTIQLIIKSALHSENDAKYRNSAKIPNFLLVEWVCMATLWFLANKIDNKQIKQEGKQNKLTNQVFQYMQLGQNEAIGPITITQLDNANISTAVNQSANL